MRKLFLIVFILFIYTGNAQTKSFSKDEVAYLMQNSLGMLKGITKTMYKGIKPRSYHRKYEKTNGDFTTLYLEETTSYKSFSYSKSTELYTQSATFKNGNEKVYEYSVYLYKTNSERTSKFYANAVTALTRNLEFEPVSANTYKNDRFTVTITENNNNNSDLLGGIDSSDRWVKVIFRRN